jgi:Cu-Zn family superoxide dismutase
MKAIAVFTGPKVKGTVRFTEEGGKTAIDIDVHGLKKNGVHGFHIHEYGDLSQGCDSACGHYNPYHKNHGGPEDKERHVGDLGNLTADADGKAQYRITDPLVKLRGTKCNIVGRGLVIHADRDDLGRGSNEASLVNGNAGKRIACAVIGWSSQCA